MKVFIAFLLIAFSINVPARDNRISSLTPISTPDSSSYIKTPIEHYCKNSPLEKQTESREDRSMARDSGPRKPSQFFSSEILDISLESSDPSCDMNCMLATSYALIESLSLWRSGCGRCDDNTLIGIRVNNELWLDTITLDKWRYAIATGADSANHDPKAINRISLRPLGRRPIVDYKRISTSDETLCAAANKYTKSNALKAYICGEYDTQCDSSACLSMQVSIGHAKSCELLSRIACGSPDMEIALNTNDFKFAYSHKEGNIIIFGNGEHQVDLLPILIHETGHWFGLEHEKESDKNTLYSIMRDSYNDSTQWCITMWNLTQIDNAVDTAWEYRLKGTHGLKYKHE